MSVVEAVLVLQAIEHVCHPVLVVSATDAADRVALEDVRQYRIEHAPHDAFSN